MGIILNAGKDTERRYQIVSRCLTVLSVQRIAFIERPFSNNTLQ